MNEWDRAAKDESLGLFARLKSLCSINGLKILYMYTIGSCIPLKYSTRCLPQDDGYETVELQESGADHRKGTSESKPATQIMDDGEELIEEEPIKKKVNLHFQNHLQKWKRQKFPWKPIFHILLVVLITVQVSEK